MSIFATIQNVDDVKWVVLFTQEDIRNPSGLFKGWALESNPIEWSSKLPALSTIDFFRSDPAFSKIIDINSSSEHLQSLARYSVFGAIRNCVTEISTAWGYFQTSVKYVGMLFDSSILALASEVSEVISSVMASIEIAVNAICWVPIVGWIIKVIFELVKIITKIITAIKHKQAGRQQAELSKIAKQFALPTAEWTPEADTVMCRELQMKLMSGVFDLEWAFKPRYPATSVSDFVAQHQKYHPDDKCFSGWLIWSNKFKDQTDPKNFPGLGFVPGTMNLHGAMSLNARAANSVKDYGEFFPITKSVAAQLWSQTVKGDSGLTFAIDTDKIITAWKEYASASYHYGMEALGGWSVISGRIDKPEPLKVSDIPGLKYNCSVCDAPYGKCTESLSKKKEKDRWIKPDGHGHRGSYLSYMKELLGWTETLHGNKLKEDDWWDTMTPVSALKNLRGRQEAMIRSPKCMYLDDSTSSSGTGQPRFRAIKKGSELHKLWVNCVTAMFESGDWKKIDYRDVIKGEEVDKAIRTTLSNQYNTTPEKYFNIDSNNINKGKASMQILAKSGPSVLGDPTPPEPPPLRSISVSAINGISLSPPLTSDGKPSRVKSSKGGSVKGSSSAPLFIGAAALALILMNNKK